MKKSICILFVSFLLLCVFGIFASAEQTVASGSCGDAVFWTLDEAGTLTVSGSGAMDDYRIKLYITNSNKAVYSPWYDYYEDIRTVVIENGVTRIGNQAFCDCPVLEAVTIGNTVTEIGEGAFAYCPLISEIDLPDSITSIGASVFDHAAALETVTLSSNLTELGAGSFSYCEQLRQITLPDGITEIENLLFERCSLLEEVRLPAGLQKIDWGAFEYCSSLQHIELPDTLTEIDYSAFMLCTALKSIEIPDSVRQVGISLFFKCSALEQVTIGTGLQQISENMFFWCGALQFLEIPSTVTTIGKNAFDSCTALTAVEYGGAACQWERIFIETGNTWLTDAARTVRSAHVENRNQTVLTPASCTSAGILQIITTCSVCREALGETTEEIPMLPHSLVQHAGKAQTNEEAGWDPYETCENCDYTTFHALDPLPPTDDPYENLTFSFSDGILTVSGTGGIPASEDIQTTPLAPFANDCRVIQIENGITSVERGAFNGFENVRILLLNGSVMLQNGAFSDNRSLETVVCALLTQTAPNAFASDTEITFFEPAAHAHVGVMQQNVNVIPYLFADGLLSFDGSVEMNTYGLLDLMTVMSSYFDDICFVRFTSYTSLDVPFYIYDPSSAQYVPMGDNVLENVRFSVQIPEGTNWTDITFNEFCTKAEAGEIGSFHLVIETQSGPSVRENAFQIMLNTIQSSVKKMLKWIVSLMNALFNLLSKLK